jgi:hypothetical protein
MKRGRNTAEILDHDDFPDDIELADNQYQERTLILKAAPPSLKTQLMAHGAVEIRCSYCSQIRSLARAEESEDGWICQHCLPKTKQKSKYRKQKERC